MTAEKLSAILPDYGASKAEDLLALIGYGKISAKQILVRIAPDGADTPPAEDESRITSVVKRVLGLGADAKLKVRGFDDLLVYRAKCCNPIRGEEIIGYITRGKGVAVHSKNCPNVQNLLYDAARKIEVEWAGVAPQAEAYRSSPDDRQRESYGHTGPDRRGRCGGRFQYRSCGSENCR